jgi:hypothetical protein
MIETVKARKEAPGRAILTGGSGIAKIAVGGWRRSVSDGSPAGNFWETNMKAILSMALVVGFCGLAGAQGAKSDPVGTWKCEYQIGDQQRTAELTITKDGDKLAGTMNWPDQKDEKIKEPQFKDGKLTFSAVRKLMGNTIPIDYTLTIDGDNFHGKGASDFGGRKQEFDIAGKREKKDK